MKKLLVFLFILLGNLVIAQNREVVYFTSDGYIDQHNVERKRFSSAKFRELFMSKS